MNGRDVGSRVAAWDRGDLVYVASLPLGPIAVLDGTAAVIWRAIGAGDRAGVVARVADAAGLGEEEIRPTVEAFLAHLVDAGLMPDPEQHLRY